VPQFVQAAADWWSSIYGNHTAVSVSVLFVHLAGLLVAASAALTSDRQILRAASADERRRVLAALPAAHGAVLSGLAAVVASGVLLTLADLEFMLHEPIFYAKLLAVALLVVNGWQLQRAERTAARGLANGWARLRLTARLSGVFWFATVLLGVMLSKA
jgi:hypothetical protein